MTIREEDLNQAKLGMAYLAACIVQTLNESDSTFLPRFSNVLSRTYGALRDQGGTVGALELLSWTLEILKEKIA
jgi:hypothetical protein